jgi:hypothetical protein
MYLLGACNDERRSHEPLSPYQASEAFLLLLYVDHGHVQFRLYQGIQPAAAAMGWSLLRSPVLTLPLLKDLLLAAFMTKQVLFLCLTT